MVLRLVGNENKLNAPFSKLLMCETGWVPRPGYANHLKDTTTSELVRYKLIVIETSSMPCIWFYASYEVWVCALQLLHQLEQLCLKFMQIKLFSDLNHTQKEKRKRQKKKELN